MQTSTPGVLISNPNQPLDFITIHLPGIAAKEEKLVSGNFHNLYGLFFNLCDIIFAFFLCLSLVILIPVLWLINLFSDRGPLFYSQERIGKNGKVFRILKFRSMVVNAEADGTARFTMENDERITRVGSFLRKTRIDEIPQAINILKGDMCFIGPRPERPEFVGLLTEKDHNYRCRSFVKPGITGWAQVKYKYTSTLDDGLIKMVYDIDYIRRRNPRMDIEIILKTASIVLRKQGT